MSDLIERQVAIDEIMDLPNCENGYSDTYDKARIVGVLEEVPSAQPERRWIPVKWREPDEKEAKYYTYIADCEMPEDEQEILVTDGKYVWKDVCYYDDGFHLDSMEDWQNITAWMPLPEPYKERREEHD